MKKTRTVPVITTKAKTATTMAVPIKVVEALKVFDCVHALHQLSNLGNALRHVFHKDIQA